HDVPIAVAGPPGAVAQTRAALDEHQPGGFEVTEVTNTEAAERLIRDRQVYGAIDLTTGTPHVMVASAGSAAVAQTLRTLAAGLGEGGAGPDTQAGVVDLAALPADDPRGVGL